MLVKNQADPNSLQEEAMQASNAGNELYFYHEPEWVYRNDKTNYVYKVSFLGSNIVVIDASGYADLDDVKQGVRLSMGIVDTWIPKDEPYIHIADYSGLKGVTRPGKQYFIEKIKTRERLIGLVFCGLSPFMKMVVKIGKRLTSYSFQIEMTDRFSQAQEKAVSILEANRTTCLPKIVKPGELGMAGPKLKTGKPVLSSKAMVPDFGNIIDFDGYFCKFEVVNDTIFHSVSKGFLQEHHVEAIEKARKKIFQSRGGDIGFNYFIADVSQLKGSARKARLRYMESIKRWNSAYPMKAIIFIGVNRAVRASIFLAYPFIPFKILTAVSFSKALELISKMESELPLGRDEDFISKESMARIEEDTTKPYADELLRFIGSINWDEEGLGEFPLVETTHPFYQIFEAIQLIKEELDQLFRERNLADQDRHEAEKRLKKSEERFRGLVEASSDYIWEIDHTGVYTYVSPKVIDLLGFSQNEVVGKTPFVFMPKTEGERLNRFFKKNIEQASSFTRVENVNLHKDGHEVILETSGEPIFDDKGDLVGFRGVGRDITERKNKELEIQKIRNLESLGLLAGGIAHDFNNLLSTTYGNIELAQFMTDPASEIYSLLDNAAKSIRQTKRLTTQLLTFSKGGDPVKEAIDMAGLIKETCHYVLKDSMIIYAYGISEDLWKISADKRQIWQVLRNLIVNAKEAMPLDGAIRVSAKNCSVEDLNQVPLKTGDYIKIVIKDEGHGIREDDVGRVFDPYFSTKPKGSGRGTGLGLTIAHSIINKHKGHLVLKSVAGKGTTVSFFLPVSD